MKYITLLFLLTYSAMFSAQNIQSIKIPVSESKKSIIFKQGANKNPQGETIEISSESMIWDGKAVVPVMGELHFSRVPESEWRERLLKMKEGGINIVATYIFWIHHEEIQGTYDWSGQRSLKKFASLCKELNFKLILRVGPWCHGEVRNGGIPDWLIDTGIKLRQSNKDYLSQVRRWYNQIYSQVDGLLWKDGGTIIGVQIENEFRGRWEHLADLKAIAVDAGFNVPLYTRTGWPKLGSPAVFGEIIPLYGDYCDGFWDRSLSEMPGDYSKAYLFRSMRSSTVIANEQLPAESMTGKAETTDYPYFTCELGGGMMPSYHRRINIAPMDIYAMTLVKIGSGSNLPGYYMYSGGTNPDGKLTYLNECQDTRMTNYNDLPVKSYDFQAPIGEFGQLNPHYYMLKKLHRFLSDFGGELASMPAHFPESSSVRWSVRTNGNSGFVFVNNYQRLKSLEAQKTVCFSVDLPKENVAFPNIDIPENTSFILPFNLNMDGAVLKYATAQLLSKEANSKGTTYYFSKIEGIPAEFVLNGKKIVLDDKKSTYSIKSKSGSQIQIALLDESESANTNLAKTDDKILFQKVKEHGALRKISVGAQNVAQSPSDSDFDEASVWKITLPQTMDTGKKLLLSIKYKGDVARIYSNGKLITDNFFNGKEFQVLLSPADIKSNNIELKVLPLAKLVPVYFQSDVELNFGDKDALCEVSDVTCFERK